MGSARLGFELWLPLKLQEDGLAAQSFLLGPQGFLCQPK